MELLTLALPFATTAIMFAFKWLGGFASFNNGAEARPLLRLFLAALSIVGAGALSFLNGTPIDPNMITGLVQIGATALLSGYLSHSFYTAVKTGQ
jgi:hypothetical protein